MPPTVLQNLIRPKHPSEAAADGPPGGLEAAALLEMLTVVVESAPVAIAMFDREMRYIMANRQWVQEFHLANATPLEGRSQYEVFPKLHPGWRQVYDRALQGYVVKSDHDVLASSSGKAILFRWEVRPWRLKSDASVAGVIVTCDKFAAAQEGVVPPTVAEEVRGEPVPTSERREEVLDLSRCELPVFTIDPSGRVMRANQRAMSLALATGVQEGSSYLWEALSAEPGRAALRNDIQALLVARLAQKTADGPQVLVVQREAVESGMPSRWLIAAQREAEELVVVGLTGLSPFDSVSKVGIRLAHPNGEANGKRIVPIQAGGVNGSGPEAKLTLVRKELAAAKEALDMSRRELRTLKEVEKTLVQRERQHQAVLEAFPGGLILLDEEGAPVMQNRALEQLFGRRLRREEQVEEWLGEACPTSEAREEVRRLWREDIWRRQLTRRLTLQTAAHLLRDLEFQPVSLETGGLLVHVHDVTDRSRLDEQLTAMEGKFRALVQDNPLPVILTDRSGSIYETNEAATELLRRSRVDLRRTRIEALFDPASAEARKVALAEMLNGNSTRCQLEVTLAGPDASRQRLTLALVRSGDQVQGALHFFEALAGVRGMAPTQGEAEPQGVVTGAVAAPAAVRAAGAHMITAAPNGRIRSWSAAAQEAFGYEAGEVLGQPLHLLFQPSNASGFYQELRAQLAASEPESVLWRYYGREGRQGELALLIRRAADGGSVLELPVAEEPGKMDDGGTADASGRSGSPARAVPLLPRPEWAMVQGTREQTLLREAHHRIRSHLQILSSLLNLQANGVNDAGARSALCSSQNRLRAIAALHTHLEQIAGSGQVNLRKVISGLVEHLQASFGDDAAHVSVVLDVPEPLDLPEEWLMPLVLTVHEAVANSFQHGYPSGRAGELKVQLTLEGTHGCLIVRDDGVGFDAEEQARDPRGLGLKVMAVFADQMRAQIGIQSTPLNGTSIEMQFSIAFM